MRERFPWHTWHLVAVYVVGVLLGALGEQLEVWAGAKLVDKWTPKPEPEDPPKDQSRA